MCPSAGLIFAPALGMTSATVFSLRLLFELRRWLLDPRTWFAVFVGGFVFTLFVSAVVTLVGLLVCLPVLSLPLSYALKSLVGVVVGYLPSMHVLRKLFAVLERMHLVSPHVRAVVERELGERLTRQLQRAALVGIGGIVLYLLVVTWEFF